MPLKTVVKITLKNGEVRWLSVGGRGRKRISLVKSRARATSSTNEEIMRIVSDHFWQHYWDREHFESRELEYFRPRR